MKYSFCALLVAAGLFSQSCSDPTAQMSIMADGYKQQIESKDKELAQLRESERSLNGQLTAMQATLDTLKEQIGKGQAGSSGIDADKVAAMIVKELEPKMAPLIAKSVEKTLASATMTAAPAPSPSPAATDRQAVPARAAAPAATDAASDSGPEPAAALPAPSDGDVRVRESSSDPNTQKFKFEFD